MPFVRILFIFIGHHPPYAFFSFLPVLRNFWPLLISEQCLLPQRYSYSLPFGFSSSRFTHNESYAGFFSDVLSFFFQFLLSSGIASFPVFRDVLSFDSSAWAPSVQRGFEPGIFPFSLLPRHRGSGAKPHFCIS